jgi:hypothetical protein
MAPVLPPVVKNLLPQYLPLFSRYIFPLRQQFIGPRRRLLQRAPRRLVRRVVGPMSVTCRQSFADCVHLGRARVAEHFWPVTRVSKAIKFGAVFFYACLSGCHPNPLPVVC